MKKTINKIALFTSDTIALELLNKLAANYQLIVFTKAAKPGGRNLQKQDNEIVNFCSNNNITYINNNIDSELTKFNPDIILVYSYGKIFSKQFIDNWQEKIINIHPSLLPKYRGPSPIQAVLLNGEKQTGVSYINMSLKMDAGPLIKQSEIKIDTNDTYTTLADKINKQIIKDIDTVLVGFMKNKFFVEQNDKLATYCKIINKSDGKINWQQPAQQIYNMWRAYYQWPKIFTFYKDKKLILHKIKLIDSQSGLKPGTVFKDGNTIGVQTKNGAIQLSEVQLAGKNKVDIKSFINGQQDFIDSHLK